MSRTRPTRSRLQARRWDERIVRIPNRHVRQCPRASDRPACNGLLQTLKDAENNLTTYEYDGHDRLAKTRLPNTPKGAGTSSTTDFEQLTYENTAADTRTSGTVASVRNRANQVTFFAYDNLGRRTLADLPNSVTGEGDYEFSYDLLNRLTGTSNTFSNHWTNFTYDALNRVVTQWNNWYGTKTSAWDLAGRRTRLTHRDGFFVDYDYLVTGEVDRIRENGATTGIGVLATYAYDNLGRRTSLTFGNGTSTTYVYDPVSRLTTLTNNLAGTANDLTIGSIAYNPASQIVSQNRSNDLYAWTGHGSGSTASVANGLNQLTSIGGAAIAHDAKGNLTSDPVTGQTYGYTADNRLVSVPATPIRYDSLGQLYSLDTPFLSFDYDATDPSTGSGPAMTAEINSGPNVIARRYVFGPGIDEPIVWYEGSDTSDRRFLSADERGSIISVTDSSGALLGINSYDEFGKPGASNIGRFQYTGQAWIPEIGAYYYKARFYAPHLGGRFLQTDPIGYWDSPNLYAYVLNDPVNLIDPLGLVPNCDCDGDGRPDPDVIVTGGRIQWPVVLNRWSGGLFGGDGRGGIGRGGRPGRPGQPGTQPPVPGTPTPNPSDEVICKTRLPGGSTIEQNVTLVSNLLEGEVSSAGWSNVEQAAAGAATTAFWMRSVAPGGRWAGRLGEPWGNWNYGATGRAVGIPLGVLLRGAGAAEKLEGLTGRTGSGSTGQGSPFGSPPYGDNPWSQDEIVQGYNARCT